MSAKKYNAVGAYIFAGGFTIGMAEKFNVLAHLEEGNFGVDTFKMNFPSIPVYTERKQWPLRELKQRHAHVVYCNPPCSPWSMAGKKKGAAAAEAAFTQHAFQLLTELEPEIWVWESVSEAITKDRAMNDHLAGQALEEGYAVTRFLHDVKFMGLPQSRRRLMTVFHKVKITWPKPNHPIVTAMEALKGVKPDEIRMSDTDREIIPLVKPGGNMIDVWNKIHPAEKRGRPGFLYRRLYLDRPSPTITGSDTKIHPTEHRRLAPSEAAVLCGYPKDYKWSSSYGRKYAEVGKTVTPPAGRYMAKVFYNALQRNEPVDDGEMWTVNFQAGSNRADDYEMQAKIEREQ